MSWRSEVPSCAPGIVGIDPLLGNTPCPPPEPEDDPANDRGIRVHGAGTGPRRSELHALLQREPCHAGIIAWSLSDQSIARYRRIGRRSLLGLDSAGSSRSPSLCAFAPQLPFGGGRQEVRRSTLWRRAADQVSSGDPRRFAGPQGRPPRCCQNPTQRRPESHKRRLNEPGRPDPVAFELARTFDRVPRSVGTGRDRHSTRKPGALCLGPTLVFRRLPSRRLAKDDRDRLRSRIDTLAQTR